MVLQEFPNKILYMHFFSEIKKRLNFLQNRHNCSTNRANKTILFWVPGGMPLLLHVEGAIAMALRLRGYKVHMIICDGPFRACVAREINDGIPLSNWPKNCIQCKTRTSAVLRSMGISYSFIGNFVSVPLRDKLWKTTKSVSWDNLSELSYEHIFVGDNVRSAIIRYLKGKRREGLEKIIREYAFSGLVCATAAAKALDKIKPIQIFMSHGTYVDWGPALKTALYKSIPITAWMASYLPARFYFRNLENGKNIDFHGLSDSEWKRCKNNIMSKKQSLLLNRYLDDRYKHNISFDMKQFMRYKGKLNYFRRKYDLNPNKPIWAVMAHINWDVVCDYSPMIYGSFDDWILDTIKEIAKIKDVQWLIKIHPAETWENTLSGAQKLIEKHFSSLPEHIHIISAEKKINPLDFIRLVDGGVTVYGTLGLELALFGKPVILTGEAHYGNKGFTYDCRSIADYKKMLKRVKSIKLLNKKQINLAKKYAYNYFIQRQIPLPVVRDPHSNWWKFQGDKKHLLKPGKDPFIDFICERILDGKDFVMNEKLVALASDKNL